MFAWSGVSKICLVKMRQDHMKAENNPDSVQFAFLMVMMTSKCGLYCWMQRTGKQSMKAISVSSVWILHLAHLVSHDILTKAIETRLMFCFVFFVFQNTNYDLIDFFVKESFIHSVIHTHWKAGKGHYHSSEKILRGRRRVVFFSRRCQRCRRSCICVRQKPSHGCWQCPDLCRLSGIHMVLHVQTSTDWIEQ